MHQLIVHVKQWSCMLRRDAQEFTVPDMRPPNSTDLNLADYLIWGVMQERVYRTPSQDGRD